MQQIIDLDKAESLRQKKASALRLIVSTTLVSNR